MRFTGSRFRLKLCGICSASHTRILTRYVAISTVALNVISLVASSCGYDRGSIEHRAAQEFTAHVATQRGHAEHPRHRHRRVLSPSHLCRSVTAGTTTAPEEWHRSGTTQRPGTTRWPHTGGETL